MTTWNDAETAAPDVAALARSRVEAHGLGLLATLRRDGAPRISGIEPLFTAGELWLGMMEGSRKARDLHRDARFSLHNATVDKQVSAGDVRISGRAYEVDDPADHAAFAAGFEAATGSPPPPGPFHLFRADVAEIVTIRAEVDHLVIETWTPDGGVRRIERR